MELILDDGASECYAEYVCYLLRELCAVGYVLARCCAPERLVVEVGICRAAKVVVARACYSVDTTARKATLTKVDGRCRDFYLADGVDRNGVGTCERACHARRAETVDVGR